MNQLSPNPDHQNKETPEFCEYDRDEVKDLSVLSLDSLATEVSSEEAEFPTEFQAAHDELESMLAQSRLSFNDVEAFGISIHNNGVVVHFKNPRRRPLKIWSKALELKQNDINRFVGALNGRYRER